MLPFLDGTGCPFHRLWAFVAALGVLHQLAAPQAGRTLQKKCLVQGLPAGSTENHLGSVGYEGPRCSKLRCSDPGPQLHRPEEPHHLKQETFSEPHLEGTQAQLQKEGLREKTCSKGLTASLDTKALPRN